MVAAVAEASMMLAINEIKELPEYAEKGEVIVCVLSCQYVHILFLLVGYYRC